MRLIFTVVSDYRLPDRCCLPVGNSCSNVFAFLYTSYTSSVSFIRLRSLSNVFRRLRFSSNVFVLLIRLRFPSHVFDLLWTLCYVIALLQTFSYVFALLETFSNVFALLRFVIVNDAALQTSSMFTTRVLTSSFSFIRNVFDFHDTCAYVLAFLHTSSISSEGIPTN